MFQLNSFSEFSKMEIILLKLIILHISISFHQLFFSYTYNNLFTIYLKFDNFLNKYRFCLGAIKLKYIILNLFTIVIIL